MGTEIDTRMTEHNVKQFWGGDSRGVCLQITAATPLKVCDSIEEQIQEEGHIQLTMEEAAAMCNDLGRFVREEAQRRQSLLREEIAQAKVTERTVFQEVAELPADLMAGPKLAVLMVSRFCPKAPNAGVHTPSKAR